MTLEQILAIFSWLWLASEILIGIFGRARRSLDNPRDRRSYWTMWGVFVGGLWLGGLVREVEWGRMDFSDVNFTAISLVVFWFGVLFRWYAIATLGNWFTVNVAVQPGHKLVRSGPYRRLRHPAYTGLLIIFLSAGLSTAGWLSLLVVLVPATLVLLHRIRIEEQVLVESFGAEYVEYCETTKRLIPGIY